MLYNFVYQCINILNVQLWRDFYKDFKLLDWFLSKNLVFENCFHNNNIKQHLLLLLTVSNTKILNIGN